MDTATKMSTETLKTDQTIEQVSKSKSMRKYDIVVLGASGFTGKFVVHELANFSQTYNLTWAIAGRDIYKLQQLLHNVYRIHNGYEDKKIDIVYVDIHDNKTIMTMAQSTSVVINCVGPYYIYGEVVVNACILKSTHYVDVAGESLFMEKMLLTYNNLAEENNSIIVSALGMESVPADLGVEFLYKHFNGELKNVDVYMQLYSTAFPSFATSAMIHDGTWYSFILHLATENQRLFYRDLLDKSMKITRVNPNISKILHKQQIDMRYDKKKWCLALPEPDQAVIARSIHHAKTVDNLPYNFNVRNYLVNNNLLSAIIIIFIYLFFSIWAAFEPLRILFVRFPRFFTLGLVSKTGPNEEVMQNSRLSLTLIGHGSTNVKPHVTDPKEISHRVNNTRKTIVKVQAKNPSYGFTSKAVVLGAITILKDIQNMPKGGILTPASAFRNTQYMNRLIEHDAATFKIESDMVIYNQHAKLN